MHADDLVRLYNSSYEARNSISGEIFNIGGGVENSLSLLELFEHLSQKLSIPPLVFNNLARRASDQDYFVADITKANQVIGWSPQVGFEKGLDLMLKWSEKLLS